MDSPTKHIAKQRIQTLFQRAEKIYAENPGLAQHYVYTARKIAMAAKIRLPAKYRRQICKKCKSLILLGINSRVRTQKRREPHIVITCLNCGHRTRIPLKKKEEKTKP